MNDFEVPTGGPKPDVSHLLSCVEAAGIRLPHILVTRVDGASVADAGPFGGRREALAAADRETRTQEATP